jgi:hypothetical protein
MLGIKIFFVRATKPCGTALAAGPYFLSGSHSFTFYLY